ncbi:insulinase family protein [Patescibacteria group bacterium]|nr:insulinase family protein [Patescibacteria group bacterium]
MDYKKFELDSGSRLITIPIEDVNTVSIVVYFGVGSRFENKKNTGVSHFIEHLMFKGTEKRKDKVELAKELDSMGAIFNAYTGKDITAYWIKVSKNYLDKALDILSDMVQNSKIEEEEIEREKGVIIQELKMYEDRSDIYVDDLLEELIFSKEDELGRLIIGTEKVLKNITKEEIIDYREKFYFPENRLITISGNIDEEEIKNKIEEYFQKDYSKEKEKNKKTIENNLLKINKLKEKEIKKDYPDSDVKVKILNKNIEQASVMLGIVIKEDFYIKKEELNLLSVILGGNMSSRLFINIREKNGLCYYIRSIFDKYQDIGILKIHSGLDKNRLFEALELIKKELLKIKENIEEEELQKAKNYIIGMLDISFEDTANVSEFYGKQYLFKETIKTNTEEKEIYRNIKLADLQELAKKIIDFSNLNIAIIGDYKTSQEEEIKQIFNI